MIVTLIGGAAIVLMGCEATCEATWLRDFAIAKGAALILGFLAYRLCAKWGEVMFGNCDTE